MKGIVFGLLLLALPALSTAQDRDLFEGRCRAGDLRACTVRGLMFELGAGESTNGQRAIDYYRLACSSGYAAGCTSIGLMYQNGRGIPRDLELAAGQFRLACDSGGELGCDLLRALEAEGPIREARPFFTGGWAADDDTGGGVENVLVDVSRLGLQATSDDQGRVSLGRIPEGTYTIRAEAVGYAPVSGVLNVPAYGELLLLLDRADWAAESRQGLIGGIVLDRRRDPVPGVQIEIVGTEGPTLVSGPQGRFNFPGVAPGIATVRITAAGHAPVETMVVVQSGRAALIEATVGSDGVDLERPPL